MFSHQLSRAFVALLLCAVAGGAGRVQAGPAAGAASAAGWAPREFPISFWCGPPSKFLTPARFREIKDAGFTHVQPPDGGATVEENRKILGLCRGAGLKAFIGDARMPRALTGDPGATARLDAIIRDYQDAPALAGYFVADEPGAAAFPGLAEVVASLREKDPRHVAFINLFPNYANAGQLGAPTYEDYLRRFLEQARPFALSYDHYHFTTAGDGPGFLPNLAQARDASRRQGVPFWNIVLCVQHGPYRNLTEGELRFEAMQTLAFGGKGLLWFTYWTPDDPSFQWAHAMINRDGSRDPHFDMVRRVNGEVRALGGPLLEADCVGVFHGGPAPPGTPLDVIAGDVTVGLFRGGTGGPRALLASADYRQATTARVMVRTRGGAPRRFNAATGRWDRVAGALARPGGFLLSLRLTPGGAALLRW